MTDGVFFKDSSNIELVVEGNYTFLKCLPSRLLCDLRQGPRLIFVSDVTSLCLLWRAKTSFTFL